MSEGENVPFPEVAEQAPEPAFPEVAQEAAPAEDVPFPEVAGPRKKTVGGFLGNVIPSAFKNVKDIGESILAAPVKAAGDVFAEQFTNKPGAWTRNPETGRLEKAGLFNPTRGGGYETSDLLKETGKAMMDIPSQMGDALIHKYDEAFQAQNPGQWVKDPATGKMVKKDASLLKALGDVAYQDPVGVALDAAVVKDLAAAGGKTLTRAGDLAAVRSAERAMGSAPLGAASIERGLQATASPNALQRVGGAVEGALELPGKALKGAATKAADLVGVDLEARKKTLQYKGEELSRVPVKQAEDYERLLEPYKALDGETRAAVAEVQRMGEGASPEALDLVRSSPEAKRAVKDYAEYLKGDREKFLEDANLLDRKTLQRRVDAQYALEKYGEITEDTLKQARRDIQGMKEYKPQYVPSEAEIREGNGVLDGLWGGKDEKMLGAPSVGRLGKVKFLEKFTGKAGIATDPLEYTKRLIDSYRKVEGNIRWIQRIESDPSLVKAVAKGEGKEIIPTEGVYKKYLQNGGKDRARAIYQMQLADKAGGAEQAVKAIQNDPAVQKRWKQIAEISANDTVRKILSMEFSRFTQQPGAMLRAYDAVIGVFRKGATKYNPHYYTGNAVGDAVLSLMGGVGPMTLRAGEKLKEFMPFQARRTASVNAEGIQTGRLGKLYDYINEVDAAGKRGIITKEVTRKLKDVGLSGFQLEEKLKEVLPSIQELGDVEVARIQLHERIAAAVEKKLGGKLSQKGMKALQAKLEAKALDAGYLERQIPDLAEKAAIVRPAVERANAFFADYVGMGPIEQGLFRRLIPFYAFNKSMAMLAFKLPFIAPKTTFLWNRYATMMQGMTQDPDAPPGYIPFGVGKDGKIFWVSAKGLSPFGGLRMTQIGKVPIPDLLNVVGQNPIFSTVFKTVGGKDMFSKASIPYGTLITGTHNGAVYEYQQDGSVKKVIDEPPLIRTIGHYMPVVGTVERALFPYQLTREGFPEYFTPEKNRAGQDKYPNASILNKPDQAVGNLLGVRTIEKSRGELRIAEAQRQKMIIQEFRNRIRNAQPDERADLIEQFKDWAKERKVSPND